MRINFTWTPTCPRCGITEDLKDGFWRVLHGDTMPYSTEYYLMTCKKCKRKFTMRLYDRKDRRGK